MISNLTGLQSEKMLNMSSVFLNLQGLLCDPECGWSWRRFHVHLRRMCILLLLDEMLYKYQLSLSGLLCHLRTVLPCWLSDLSIGISGVLKSITITRLWYLFLLLQLLVFAFYIEMLLCWGINVHNCGIFFWDWFLDIM